MSNTHDLREQSLTDSFRQGDMLYLEPIEKTAVPTHMEGRFYHIPLDTSLLIVAYQTSSMCSAHHSPVALNPPIWAMRRYIDEFESCCRETKMKGDGLTF